ncbi:hypothetical protein SCLCIDRAFT_16861 [Scleroderma citrinum Foug A]|uniref:Thioesterase domain-containing protein n=1 Tax=Scleroderma citrinum Foug A TaxID=1036808 RepID=A0A0C2Z7H8_9AGAM|nr:hypothetical protein SCLCIDRAFT_16861 [Scleroderma citrinum Foug A]
MDAKERVNVSLIGGNASIDLKRSFFDIFYEQLASPKGAKGFESEIASRIIWKEMSLLEVAEEPEKLEGRTVFEITVEDDMVNPAGALHGGCSALLINSCSTMPIALLSLATTGRAEFGASQSLSIVYHSPAMLGDRLRIVGATLSVGSRILSSRCEIWNAAKHRLVATGVHIKMPASVSKPDFK